MVFGMLEIKKGKVYKDLFYMQTSFFTVAFLDAASFSKNVKSHRVYCFILETGKCGSENLPDAKAELFYFHIHRYTLQCH